MGILIKFIPRLKILATKPDTSPVIPPPMLIIKSDLLKLSLNNFSKILFTVLIDLDFSLALKFKKINSYFFLKYFLKIF